MDISWCVLFSLLKSCGVSPLSMAEVQEQTVFAREDATLLVEELQKSFKSGKTKSYEWRLSQLQSLRKMIEEREKDILEALYKDLSKPQLEAYVSEVWMLNYFCLNYYLSFWSWDFSLCLFYLLVQSVILFSEISFN